MTRHDGQSPAPDASNEPPERPSTGSGAEETTGTWAFVSPFAASPGPYLATGSSGGSTPPAPAEPPAVAGQPAEPAATFGRPDWGPAGPPGWENTATGAVGGGAWTPGAPPHQHPNQPPHQAPIWGAPAAANDPSTWGAPAAPDPGGTPASRWKTWQKVAAGGVLAGVVAVGGVAAVSAANASSNTGTTQAGFAGGGQGFAGGESGPAGGGMRGGMAGAMELANALHGDFVVSGDSGTQTMRLQSGELTAVAAGSITVTSTDGYISTYAIGSGVDVSGLTQGATVRVLATVDGDTATATAVMSGTGGFGGGAGQGQSDQGTGRGGPGMQAPEGVQAPPDMTEPDGTGQAPPTS